MPFTTLRAGRARLTGLVLCALGTACSRPVQKTAYMGDGVYAGSPPLCFQYREESRPGPSYRSLLVHFNNTCDFALDCLVYNDVTEQEQRVIVMSKQHSSLLVATGMDVSRFDAELDCTWHG
jgi:hypothetical protein